MDISCVEVQARCGTKSTFDGNFLKYSASIFLKGPEMRQMLPVIRTSSASIYYGKKNVHIGVLFAYLYYGKGVLFRF